MSWKSKGLPYQNIKATITTNNFLNSSLNYVGSKIRARFTGDCLKKEKIEFNHRKIVNIYIIYEIEKIVNISILMLICIIIQDMVLDLIEKDFFRTLLEEMEKT